MSAVREYIFSLMTVSLCCGVVSVLTPDNSSLNKYVRFLLSLIVTVMLISPVGSVITVIPELIENGICEGINDIRTETYDYVDPIINKAIENITREVETEIKNKFGVEPYEVLVYYDSSNPESIIITGVTVIYGSENKLLFNDTKRFVATLVGNECEVICRSENGQ